VKNKTNEVLLKLPQDKLTTSFLYRLIDLSEMSKNLKYYNEPKFTIWKSKLSYSFRRNIGNEYEDVLANLDCLIEHYPKEFKLAVFEFIYKRR